MTFDHVYDGKDVIGRARTGSGKTLSFVLPIIEKLSINGSKTQSNRPRVLVMLPTRELAKQVSTEFEAVGAALHLKAVCIYGGAAYGPQEGALRRGVDVVVGTPGRIIDHLDRQTLKLDNLQFVVLDEADKMLEMGFADDMDKILSLVPATQPHQTLLFSATVPDWVTSASQKYMDPKRLLRVDLIGHNKNQTSETVKHYAICCSPKERSDTLSDVVKVYGQNGRTIIFASTKAQANDIALSSSIAKDCQVLHGDVIQSQRELTLTAFREGRVHVLVATDVAARGLDVPEIDLVINCEPPKDHSTYIHRSGRTGRAGRSGVCITFFTHLQQYLIRSIELKAKITISRIGTPQAQDLIKSALDIAVAQLEKVNDAVLPFFEATAKKLIEANGGEKALAAALATLTGYTTPLKQRSLLASVDGYTTVLVRSKSPIQSPRYVMNVIAGLLDVNIDTLQFKGIRLTKDGGAVVDIPSSFAEKVTTVPKPYRYQDFNFSLPTELPELIESERDSGGGRFGGNRFGGGGGGRSFGGGGGNWRGGGGNWRGGGGGGGNWRGGRGGSNWNRR